MVPNAIDLWGLQAYVITQMQNDDGETTHMSVASHQNSDGEVLNNGATDANVLVYTVSSDGTVVESEHSELTELQSAVLEEGGKSSRSSGGFLSDDKDFDSFDPETTSLEVSSASIDKHGPLVTANHALGPEDAIDAMEAVIGFNNGEIVFSNEAVFANQKMKNSIGDATAAAIDQKYSPRVGTSQSVNQEGLVKAAGKSIMPIYRHDGKINIMGVSTTTITPKH